MDRRETANVLLAVAWAALLAGAYFSLRGGLEAYAPAWLVMALFFLVWLAGSLTISLHENREWWRVGEALGAEPHGHATGRWRWASVPDLHLHEGDRNIVITTRHTGTTDDPGDGMTWTHVRVPLHRAPADARLRARRRSVRRRTEGVRVGVPDFDRRYHVDAGDAAWARRVLAPPLCERLAHPRPVHGVDVDPKGVTLILRGRVLDPARLRAHAATGRAVAESVEGTVRVEPASG